MRGEISKKHETAVRRAEMRDEKSRKSSLAHHGDDVLTAIPVKERAIR